jgi:hypothetical protein
VQANVQAGVQDNGVVTATVCAWHWHGILISEDSLRPRLITRWKKTHFDQHFSAAFEQDLRRACTELARVHVVGCHRMRS